jgi:ribonucleoside-triphosphate reductase
MDLEDYSRRRGYQFAIESAGLHEKQDDGYQETTDHLYNLEATPAESTAYRLAKRTKRNSLKYLLPERITRITQTPLTYR